MDSYTWKRCSDIFPNAQVIVDGIHTGDIIQGGLGTCYFLSVLSSAAEEGDDLEERIETKEKN